MTFRYYVNGPMTQVLLCIFKERILLKFRLTVLALAAGVAVSLSLSQASAQGRVGAPGGVSNSSPGNSEGSSAGGTGSLSTTAEPSGRIVLNPRQSANSGPIGTIPMSHRNRHHHHRHHNHR